MNKSPDKNFGDIWVVAGAPGSGKTTIANIFQKHLKPLPALLDKDTMYRSFVNSILARENHDPGEREGNWYNKHIKIHEYSGMTATAKEIRTNGCTVLLCAPFTKQIHSSYVWREWVDELGGENVRLIWVKTDKETVRARLESRGFDRDTRKLENFNEFLDYMQLDSPPPVDHFAIDNRLSAAESLENQIIKIVKK